MKNKYIKIFASKTFEHKLLKWLPIIEISLFRTTKLYKHLISIHCAKNTYCIGYTYSDKLRLHSYK